MKGYLYAGISVVILIIGIFLIYQNNVEIQNIQVQPAIIRVGDTFTINATLVNNSKNPIYVNVSPCRNTISVHFDSHVTVDAKNTLCEDILGHRIVNPGGTFTISYPDYSNDFRAVESGITNADVTLFYQEKRDTPEITISKSFTFTILDK